MTLHNDWRAILRRAWSMRLAALAGVLSGVEAVLPFFSEAIPRGLFAVLALLASTGAMVARVVAQRNMK